MNISVSDFRIEKNGICGVSASPTGISGVYEIIYILGGQKKYFINNSLYGVSSGCAALIGMGDVWNDRSTLTDAPSDTEYYVISFAPPFLNELSQMISSDGIRDVFSSKKIRIPDKTRRYFEELLRALWEEYNSPGDSSQILIRLYVSELIIYLMRFSKEPCEAALDAQEERIVSICRHICNYYNEPINLSDMAKLVYMSPTYFSKKFKKITGFGFNEYLNNIRVKIAADMLANTNSSITQTAMCCGYQDSNYFGDVFRRITGMSPSKYRKIHRL